VVGIGTDTGGSTRIPASFCGVVGFKPTQRRVTRDGGFPLSPSLDSVGPIASSVEWCAIADAVIADDPVPLHPPVALAGLRVAVPLDYVTESLDDIVGDAFERALSALSIAGARIEHMPFPELRRIPEVNARGTISNAESFAFHSGAGYLEHLDAYDPNVVRRIEIGRAMTREHYDELVADRARLIGEANARTRGYDALLFPSTPAVAPRFDDVAAYDTWSRHNGVALRNSAVVNLLDRCAVSLPMPAARLPAGLTIMGETMDDARLLAIAACVERALG
jgi:aspartyl-tRNA(Asn)/glutamyl-tRNA(Gln) amidotransferase subunit A